MTVMRFFINCFQKLISDIYKDSFCRVVFLRPWPNVELFKTRTKVSQLNLVHEKFDVWLSYM